MDRCSGRYFAQYRLSFVFPSPYWEIGNSGYWPGCFRGREKQQVQGIKKASPLLKRLPKSGIDLLSHPQKGSTISASGLNFSVRYGKRWTSLLQTPKIINILVESGNSESLSVDSLEQLFYSLSTNYQCLNRLDELAIEVIRKEVL